MEKTVHCALTAMETNGFSKLFLFNSGNIKIVANTK